MLSKGDIVAGRYLLLDIIGEGAMGVVFKAEHRLMRKTVAVKVLRKALTENVEFAERFRREAQAASLIDDPNVCAVTDCGTTEEGSLFLVMEYLDGESLSDRLKRDGRMGEADAIKIILQILSALRSAHAKGIVHRDVKPDNIFLLLRNGGDFVKLLDFGIARVDRENMTEEAAKLTQAGKLYGTPQYLSPEQALGEEVDHRGDLYAVGLILYELLTGTPAFSGDNIVQLMSMHVYSPMPRLVEQPYAISQAKVLDDIIAKLSDKDSGKRYPNAQAAFDALFSVLTSLSQTTKAETLLPTTSLVASLFAMPVASPLSEESNGKITKRLKCIRNILILLLLVLIAAIVAKLVYNSFSSPKGAELHELQRVPEPEEAVSGFTINSGSEINEGSDMKDDPVIVEAAESIAEKKWEYALMLLETRVEKYASDLNFVKLLAYTHFQLSHIPQTIKYLGVLINTYPEAGRDDWVVEIILSMLSKQNLAPTMIHFIESHMSPAFAEALARGIITGKVGTYVSSKRQVKELLINAGEYITLPQWLRVSIDLRLEDTRACKSREALIKKLLALDEAEAWGAIEPFSRVSTRGCKTRFNRRYDCQECIRPLIKQARNQFEVRYKLSNPQP